MARLPDAPAVVAVLTRRQQAYLIDAVMVLIHGMQQVPGNDGSELPGLQQLLTYITGL